MNFNFKSNKSILNGIIFSAIGGGILIFGVHVFLGTLYLTRHSVQTNGVVLELKTGFATGGGRRSSVYSPVVKFQSSNGTSYTFTSSNWTSPSLFSVGDKIDVIYDPNNPKYANIKSFSQLWVTSILIFIVGIVPFIAGLGILLKAYSNKKRITSNDY